MKKTAHLRCLVPLLAAACLLSPLPIKAAEVSSWPAGQERRIGSDDSQIQRELSKFAVLPNSRPERLDRYAAWAQLYPKRKAEAVVFQVNLDLDREFYETPEEAADPANLMVLVNKHNILPADYVPELEALGADYGSGALRPEAAQAFRAMAGAAREDGVTLYSVSAYRSYSQQANTYNRYLGQYSRKTVDTFSARPGHSEHQTGLAVDINAASRKAHFEKTPAFAWLVEHCAEYGFILRYDQGKEAVTGYRFEPWHYRYVGVETAQSCMKQGLSYEEYLGLQPESGEEPGLTPAFMPESIPVSVMEGESIEV